MSEDIKVTDGTILEALNNKVDLDGGNYKGSELEAYIHEHCGGGGGLEVGDIGFTQGYIDETKNQRRYLNKSDNYIIQEQFEEFTTWLKNSAELNPDMVCTNEEYEIALAMSVDNVCDKYVIDDEAGTIRLPKYPDYFINNLTVPSGNIPVVGNGMGLGLTDGSQYGAPFYTGTGDSYRRLVPGQNGYGTNVGASCSGGFSASGKTIGVVTDATKSGLIAKLENTTVEKIKGHYFIQVATGASESIDAARAVEINNPFFFGQSQYFESAPNNLSWVKSTGSYLSRAVYPDYYDWLLKIFNGTETQEGVSVKDSSATDITDYDFAINTTDETFRLPLLNGEENLPSGKKISLSLGNSGATYTAPANGWFYVRKTSGIADGYINISNMTSGMSEEYANTTHGSVWASVRIEANRGDVVSISYDLTGNTINFNFVYAKGNGDLYYYIGEGIVNPQLVNVARIEEKIVDLIPDNSNLIASYAMPSNKYTDLTIGATGATYIAPANGWFYAFLVSSAAKGHWGLTNNSSGELSTSTNNTETGGAGISIYLPAKKSDSVVLDYYNVNLSHTATKFRFIYAEGDK